MNDEILLDVQDIRKYFAVRDFRRSKKSVVKAVDGISLQLYQGETYGLVGESGCGKSTLGRLLVRLLDPSDGKIMLQGSDITHASMKELQPYRQRIQMVFQDPYTSLDPRMPIGNMLMEILQIHYTGSKEARMEKAMSILHKVGLRPEHFYRYPHEFSGGQRQRIGLARALILDPQIIICDEPVSALDVSIQAKVINLLKDLQKDSNLTYLFISHDMSVVRYISRRIGVLYLGHMVEEAETDTLFNNPLHPYTKALLSAVPSPNPHLKRERITLEGDIPTPINPPSGCVFHPRCPFAMNECSHQSPVFQEREPGHKVACLLYR